MTETSAIRAKLNEDLGAVQADLDKLEVKRRELEKKREQLQSFSEYLDSIASASIADAGDEFPYDSSITGKAQWALQQALDGGMNELTREEIAERIRPYEPDLNGNSLQSQLSRDVDRGKFRMRRDASRGFVYRLPHVADPTAFNPSDDDLPF